MRVTSVPSLLVNRFPHNAVSLSPIYIARRNHEISIGNSAVLESYHLLPILLSMLAGHAITCKSRPPNRQNKGTQHGSTATRSGRRTHPFAQLGDNFIFAQDVLVNLLRHGVSQAGGGRRSDAPDLMRDPRRSASSGHHTRTSPTCSP